MLTNHGLENKVIIDSDTYEGFNYKKIGQYSQSKKNFNNLIDDYKPDLVLANQRDLLSLYTIKKKIPLFFISSGRLLD